MKNTTATIAHRGFLTHNIQFSQSFLTFLQSFSSRLSHYFSLHLFCLWLKQTHKKNGMYCKLFLLASFSFLSRRFYRIPVFGLCTVDCYYCFFLYYYYFATHCLQNYASQKCLKLKRLKNLFTLFWIPTRKVSKCQGEKEETFNCCFFFWVLHNNNNYYFEQLLLHCRWWCGCLLFISV